MVVPSNKEYIGLFGPKSGRPYPEMSSEIDEKALTTPTPPSMTQHVRRFGVELPCFLVYIPSGEDPFL